VTALAVALTRAQHRLLVRLQALDAKLEAGDDDDIMWDRYTATLSALVAIITEPERSGRPISAAELAAKFNVSRKTIQRRRRKDAGRPVLRTVGA
jgi:hypothetical protein